MTDRRTHQEDFIKERRAGDRRAHERTPVAITMELTAGNDLYFHVSANLSEGGAFFNRAIPHPIGTEVALTFQLPGDDPTPVRCRGEVVNIPQQGEGLGMGVRFLDITDEDRARVVAFTERVKEIREDDAAPENDGGDGGDGLPPEAASGE